MGFKLFEVIGKLLNFLFDVHCFMKFDKSILEFVLAEGVTDCELTITWGYRFVDVAAEECRNIEIDPL